MKALFKFFDHSSCHIEIADTRVWFNPPLAWLDGELSTKTPATAWCLLTYTDDAQAKAIAAWAASMPNTKFVAPAGVAAMLVRAGLSEIRIYKVDCEPLQLAPALCLRAVNSCGESMAQDKHCAGYILATDAGKLLLGSPNNGFKPDLETLQAIGPVHTAFFPIGEPIEGDDKTTHAMSTRTAFLWAQTLDVKQLVTTCSVTTPYGLYPEELRLVHARMGCKFNLLLSPTKIQIGVAKASVVVRTLNEAKHLRALLEGIATQQTEGLECEVVLVDSGSTDDTLAIAEHYGCRILHIKREDFSFGRSLNIGCDAATGSILVITSGHCVPADHHWLQKLCEPLLQGTAQYSYGKQIGGAESHFSEHRVFEKYFPAQSQVPQEGYYCNNANSALLKTAWQRYRFNEDLTGLEDMELAQRLAKDGGLVGYVAEARVCHHHTESWAQVRRRFEREAIALQQIMPNVHVGLFDALRYITSSIWIDLKHAYKAGVMPQKAAEIILYRYHQYSGSYIGNHEHRKLSQMEKEKYFYPHYGSS